MSGISMEGANLSGLPEEPSELVTLLCNMHDNLEAEFCFLKVTPMHIQYK